MEGQHSILIKLSSISDALKIYFNYIAAGLAHINFVKNKYILIVQSPGNYIIRGYMFSKHL